MSAIRELIEAYRHWDYGEHTSVVNAAEAELEELEKARTQGVVVLVHQYENVCKQREEVFVRARTAETELKKLEDKLAERDRHTAELMRGKEWALLQLEEAAKHIAERDHADAELGDALADLTACYTKDEYVIFRATFERWATKAGVK